MKILLAPDSFKESLTALEVSNIMKKAIIDTNKDIEVFLKPMADGGEGTLDSLLTGTEGDKKIVICKDALGNKISTSYAIIDNKTVVIELANIFGISQVPKEKRDPNITTSYGLGEVIVDALDKGYNDFFIGIGGSATNDGGLGMLQALGLVARDKNGSKLNIFGKDMRKVKTVDYTNFDKRILKAKINVGCDVSNSLTGNNGATAVYGPQKGIKKEDLIQYDKDLNNFGNIIEKAIGKELKNNYGAGAAGGVGFAFMSMGAKITSGAQFIANSIEIEKAIKESDLVITGEGRSDKQTLYGKTPSYIATLAEKHKVPTLLISGSLADNLKELNVKFGAAFSIINTPTTVESCIEKAQYLLYNQMKQILYLLTIGCDVYKKKSTK